MSKSKDHFDLCKSYGDFITYACRHNGYKDRVKGSHQIIVGPYGSMPIKCNHLSEEPQAGIRHEYLVQMTRIGIEIIH